jgi:hypothetical protein
MQVLAEKVKQTQDYFTIETEKEALLISPYTLQVQGLPLWFTSQTEFNRMITELLDENCILKTVIVYDVSKRIELEKQLEKYKNRLEHYEYIYRHVYDADPSRRPITTLWCHFDRRSGTVRSKVDAMDYYTSQVRRVELEIKRWNACYRRVLNDQYDGDALYRIQGAGFGYVIFRSPIDVIKCLRKYQETGLSLRYFNKAMSRSTSVSPMITSSTSHLNLARSRSSTLITGSTSHLNIARSSTLSPPTSRNSPQVSPNELRIPKSSSLGNIQGVAMLDDDQVDFDDNLLTIPDNIPRQLPLRKSISREALSDLARSVSMDAVAANFKEMQCNVTVTRDEPQDIDYDQLYNYFKGGRYEPIVRRVFLQLSLLLIFCFFATPLAIVSGLQAIIARNETIRDSQVATIWHHIYHAIVYQYLPTLLMFLISILLTTCIMLTTTLDHYKTMSEMGRTTMRRGYIYAVIAGLLLPSFWLSSIDGIAELIAHGELAIDTFSRLFLPASGAFFMNLVIQRALLKGAADVLRLHDVILYLWHSRSVYLLGKKRTNIMSPKEHLAYVYYSY